MNEPGNEKQAVKLLEERVREDFRHQGPRLTQAPNRAPEFSREIFNYFETKAKRGELRLQAVVDVNRETVLSETPTEKTVRIQKGPALEAAEDIDGKRTYFLQDTTTGVRYFVKIRSPHFIPTVSISKLAEGIELGSIGPERYQNYEGLDISRRQMAAYLLMSASSEPENFGNVMVTIEGEQDPLIDGFHELVRETAKTQIIYDRSERTEETLTVSDSSEGTADSPPS
jgi:hypothetical protein